MRGCTGTIEKDGCHSISKSATVCYCSDNLCNAAMPSTDVSTTARPTSTTTRFNTAAPGLTQGYLKTTIVIITASIAVAVGRHL